MNIIGVLANSCEKSKDKEVRKREWFIINDRFVHKLKLIISKFTGLGERQSKAFLICLPFLLMGVGNTKILHTEDTDIKSPAYGTH